MASTFYVRSYQDFSPSIGKKDYESLRPFFIILKRRKEGIRIWPQVIKISYKV